MDLHDLKFDEFSALMIPGGFGAAKNFSDFALQGNTVHEDVQAIIEKFHSNKKPIGATCIASMILAKVLGNVKITLGMCGEKFPY